MLLKRHELLQQQGVMFELGVNVDDKFLQQLVQNHDAIFLGTGAQSSRDLKLPGQQLVGVSDAISYLAEVNQKQDHTAMNNKSVIILGGGDSAMDCARSAIRQGASKVVVAYRDTEEKMRASPKEKQAALDEGVRFLFKHQPLEILGDNAVSRIGFKNHDNNKYLDCDCVIFAIGQINKIENWMMQLGIQTDEDGVVIINKHGRTSHEKVYAGGDNTNGPDLVVTAIASGRLAAEGILQSFSPLEKIKKKIIIKKPEALLSYQIGEHR